MVVDLFGDLDLTLVGFLTETLADIVRSGATDVTISTRGLALTSNGALRALDRAIAAVRSGGTTVEIVPGNRKMRIAFAGARIALRRTAGTRPPTVRHFMLARHAEQGELDRSA